LLGVLNNLPSHNLYTQTDDGSINLSLFLLKTKVFSTFPGNMPILCTRTGVINLSKVGEILGGGASQENPQVIRRNSRLDYKCNKKT